MAPILSFEAQLWLWNAQKGSWHFLTVPAEYAPLIKSFAIHERGFGSVPVRVTIGDSSWKTSVFPDSKSGTYILPVKAAVRKVEKLEVVVPFVVTISLLDL